ncbi:GNAT family N-acetyltransferase [Algibacter pectinivorans]|uniref:Predicted N-acyltransferase, GNAT family n=1 Tax=Algibacter pectinivorans TaxID=870482 RepID=A0A1I1PN90_9FLAO|nr:GNAT family N-acetyltransferase [Algibacter pectinivorans]SFD11192.1 Predicted N-acyltransferase, GNAT family [Algibacter pectinivorans]
MTSFCLKFIHLKSPYYKEAVAVRESLFFQNMDNSLDLINDEFELNGVHLVCLKENEVVGTGRLNIKNQTGVISQMAIKSANQKQGVGSKILMELVKYSKEKELVKIKLSARETALKFYEKHGFVVIGDLFPSKKTSIIHQQMELKIE